MINYAGGNLKPLSFGGTNKHGAHSLLLHLPLSLFLMQRLIFLSFFSSLLHLLPVVHLRLMILSSDCGNYPCPAAAMHYAQQTHKAWKGARPDCYSLASWCMLGDAYPEHRQGPETMADLDWEYLAPPADDWCVNRMTLCDAVLFVSVKTDADEVPCFSILKRDLPRCHVSSWRWMLALLDLTKVAGLTLCCNRFFMQNECGSLRSVFAVVSGYVATWHR